jgi:protein phosphatase
MSQRFSIQYACKSDMGCKRTNNEDTAAALMCPEPEMWWNRGHLFVVADGMGGHAVGELASKTAVENVLHTYYKSQAEGAQKALEEAFIAANTAVNTRGTANREFQRMGTTCTSISISGEGINIAHVGDSRAYRVRLGRIDQLTFDHSLQWEKMRQTGKPLQEIMTQEPKNIITRSVGPEAQVKVDLEGPYPIEAGDVFLLCSDGLTNFVGDNELGFILETLSPHDAVNMLTSIACLRGGFDNVTAIVIKIGKDAPSASVELAGNQWNETGVSPTAKKSYTAFILATLILILVMAGGVAVSIMGHAVPGMILSFPALVMLIALWFKWKSPADEQQLVYTNPDETVYFRPHSTCLIHDQIKMIETYYLILKKLWHKIEHETGWKYKPAADQSLIAQLDKSIQANNHNIALVILSQLYQRALAQRPSRNISLIPIPVKAPTQDHG